MVGKVPWNVNGLDGIEHKPGKTNAEAEGHTLGHQTRQITAQGARKVEKGSEAEARFYSARHDYPLVDKLWAVYFVRYSAFWGGSGIK
jgi:hypothetical protein